MPTTLENPNEALTTPCAACGAAMLPDQDWCLSCGTAAPGRLGRRPGGRAIGAVSAAVVVLVLAAVLAGYTALTDDANDEASKAAGPSVTPIPGQVAQVPDAPATTVAPPVTTPPAATSTPSVPTTATTPPAFTPPAVTPPAVTPPAVTPPAVTPPAVTPPPPPATTTGTTGTTTSKTTTTTPAVTLEPIELGADAVDKYDPSGRIVRSGDPADAYDGNARTAWSVITPKDGFPMQVGLLIDLEKARNVKTIDLGTTTPGGRVEVYGAVGSAIPDDILDTRWEHVASRSKVDDSARFGNKKGDGVEKIRLPGAGATGSRFRYVLLWFTGPPTAGPTVRVTEVGLKG